MMEMSLSCRLFLNMNSFLCNLNTTVDVTVLLLQKSLILSSFPQREKSSYVCSYSIFRD